MAELNPVNIIHAAEASMTGEAPKPKTYTVRGLSDIAMLKVEPQEEIWNGMTYLKNGIIEVIGAPGVGKSRFLASLAKAQILGREFGGLPTLDTPKRWLFVGSENDINRLHREAQKFLLGNFKGDISNWTKEMFYEAAALNGLAREQVDLINANFRTFTLEDPSDCMIALCEENCLKLTATLKECKPDILVCDPWGDLIDGDELSDADVRHTIRALRECLAAAELSIPTIIVNHARMGIKEVIKAAGIEAGNMGKNSKCLYSIARYVLNLRPASFSDNPPIEVICAKNNNGPKPPPLALKLDEKTETYEPLEGFDHAAWQNELASSQSSSSGRIKEQPMSNDERNCFVRRVYNEIIVPHGPCAIAKTDMARAISNHFPGIGKKNLELIKGAVLGEAPDSKNLIREIGIEVFDRGFPRGIFIGTHDQVEFLRQRIEEGNARKARSHRKSVSQSADSEIANSENSEN